MEDFEELIGQIIDIFEDNLTERDMACYTNNPRPEEGIIPLHFEDEDSDGVFYGGEHYDNVAKQLRHLLNNFQKLEK